MVELFQWLVVAQAAKSVTEQHDFRAQREAENSVEAKAAYKESLAVVGSRR